MQITTLSPWLNLFSKLALCACFLWVVSKQLPKKPLPIWCEAHRVTACLWGSVVLVACDYLIIWPFLRSPLRHLPSIDFGGVHFMGLVYERPRGRTPLEWMLRLPDADIIHIRGLLGDSILIPVSPRGFRDIMGPSTYSLEKQWAIRDTLARIIGFGLILSEGENHKRQRKALTPAFSLNNIRSLYPLMWTKAQNFVSCVEGEALQQGFVEVSHWASKLTLDIIGHSALSRNFGALDQPVNEVVDSFAEILDPSFDRVAYFALGLVLPQWLLTKLPLKTNRVLDYHCEFLRRTCEEILFDKKKALSWKARSSDGQPLETEVEEADIMREIIEDGSFTDTEIVDQMLTILAAGHETTASALTWCCYLLAQNPSAQEQLFNELRSHITLNPSDVNYKMFEELPYLNGCCEEVLRLYPTVPTTMREVTQDYVMCDTLVPKGTTVLIVPYAVNRNPQFWGQDASLFKPERWIDVAPDGVATSNKHGGSGSNLCNMTFLHGSRSCIGRDFAKAELRCAVACLFLKFTVTMWDADEIVEVAGTVTTRPNVGMKIKLQRR